MFALLEIRIFRWGGSRNLCIPEMFIICFFFLCFLLFVGAQLSAKNYLFCRGYLLSVCVIHIFTNEFCIRLEFHLEMKICVILVILFEDSSIFRRPVGNWCCFWVARIVCHEFVRICPSLLRPGELIWPTCYKSQSGHLYLYLHEQWHHKQWNTMTNIIKLIVSAISPTHK